ncbi:MAG: GatB/YqeY domain-containing protein [Parcubacteria group bacterium]|jgi:hypothetical protein
MLHEQIKTDLIAALKSGDKEKAGVLRFLISAVKNFQIEKKAQDKEYLSDEDVLLVITRQAKQRKDSIEEYAKGGRDDLAQKERAELAILEIYLPTRMSEEEVKKIVDQRAAELGISDKSGFGKLMGVAMKDLQGKADGAIVKKIVEEKLS